VSERESWKHLNRAAVAETDSPKRLGRIEEAEEAIKQELRIVFEQGSSSERLKESPWAPVVLVRRFCGARPVTG